MHLTVQAGKLLVNTYYDQGPAYSYFEGCSQGGRQGFMSAQRFPNDFDGIVAGAPAFNYQGLNAAGTWNLQRMFRNNLAGNLAVDSNGDGSYESLNLIDVLHERVLQKCDASDGLRDGLVSDPLNCNFNPDNDLSDLMCPTGSASDSCFTPAQLQTINDFYNGPRDDAGRQVYPGKMFGSEPRWPGYYVPSARNNMGPSKLMGVAGDHMNYLFYDQDPGVTVPDVRDIHYQARRDGVIPEFHWFDWDINDFYSGKGDVMKAITDANDPDLTQFLVDADGKMIIYTVWWTPSSSPPIPSTITTIWWTLPLPAAWLLPRTRPASILLPAWAIAAAVPVPIAGTNWRRWWTGWKTAMRRSPSLPPTAQMAWWIMSVRSAPIRNRRAMSGPADGASNPKTGWQRILSAAD